MAVKVDIRRPTPEDLQTLVARLRPADMAEMLAGGCVDIATEVENSVAASVEVRAAFADGELAAVFGVITDVEALDAGLFWCLGTPVIDRRKKDFVRTARRMLDDFLQIHAELYNAVDVRNTLALRWLRSVGCEIGEPYPVGETHFVWVTLRKPAQQSLQAVFDTLPPSRCKILAFEDALKQHPHRIYEGESGLETLHHFAPGVYVREFRLPKGVAVTGKIHRHEHLAMLIKGKAVVSSEFDVAREIQAPCIFLSPPGVKRVVLGIEDAVFVTVHPVESTDLDEIEKDVICESYEEFDRHALSCGVPLRLGEYVL